MAVLVFMAAVECEAFVQPCCFLPVHQGIKSKVSARRDCVGSARMEVKNQVFLAIARSCTKICLHIL
eukprot:3104896-Rhodomonas_salina.2